MTGKWKLTLIYFEEKEMTAKNKNATFILVLNITNVPNFEVWKWFK